MNKFRILHHHEYGNSIFDFESEHDLFEIMRNLDDEEQEKFANEVLGIEYEPELDEYLEFLEIDPIDTINEIPSEYLK